MQPTVLHGNIEINGQRVGYWEAVRGERVMGKTNRYECKLYTRNNEGHPMHAEFQVVHHEDMGAAFLAQMVLTNGVKKLKGYPPGGDTEFPL